MCAAHGKPKPSIRWLKGDKDVSSQLFDIVTDENESKYCTLQNFCYDPNLLFIYKKFFWFFAKFLRIFSFAATDGIHTVQSTLRFSGRDRRNGNQLMPIDSGLYACIFENAVKRAESTMNLRVERKLKEIFA